MFLIFFLFCLFDGLGLVSDRLLLNLLSLTIPTMALITIQRRKQSSKKAPTIITALVCCLLVGLVISQLFSVNIDNSLPRLFLWVSGLVLFFYSYLYQTEVKKWFSLILLTLSVVFTLYAWWLEKMVGSGHFLELVPLNGYNFVFSTFSYHNHLGDFLVLPAVWGLWQFVYRQKAWGLGLILVSLPAIYYSYSRTGYMALALSTLLMLLLGWKKPSIVNRYILVTILSLAGLAFFIHTTESQALLPGLPVVNKSLFNGREYIWQQALDTIRANPLTGVGLGNFFYASLNRMTLTTLIAYNTESLFLNVMAETGVINGLLFMALVVLVLYKSNKKSAEFFLLVALLLTFQTDYIYNISSLWYIFFVLMGLAIRKENINEIRLPNYVPPVIITAICLYLGLINTHYLLLYLGQNRLALAIYPFHKLSYQKLIAQDYLLNNPDSALYLIGQYTKIFPHDPQVQIEAANYYLKLNRKKEALSALKRAYFGYSFENQLYKRLYYLEEELEGIKKASWILTDYQQKLAQIPDSDWRKQELKDDFIFFQKLNRSTSKQ